MNKNKNRCNKTKNTKSKNNKIQFYYIDLDYTHLYGIPITPEDLLGHKGCLFRELEKACIKYENEILPQKQPSRFSDEPARERAKDKNNNDKNNRGSGSSSSTKKQNNPKTDKGSSNKKINKIVSDRAKTSLMEFRQSLVELTNAISEALESVLYTHQTALNIDYSSRNNYDDYE